MPFHHMKAVKEILEMKLNYLVTSQVVSESSDRTGRVMKAIV